MSINDFCLFTFSTNNMNLMSWSEVLNNSFQELWIGVIEFLPNLVVALLIFILGWIIGAVLGKAVAQILRSLKIDNALKSAGFEAAVTRAGFHLDAGAFVGILVKWFIIAVFLIASLDVLELTQVNDFLQQVVVVFLPRVIVSVLILLVGVIIAGAMQHVVVGSAKAAHMKAATFLGAVTRWSIYVFAALAALFQLGVATQFIQTLFTGVVIALSLAFGLAFGLGGQDAAKVYLKKLEDEITEKDNKK